MKQWNREYIEICSRQWDQAMANTDNFSAEIRSKQEVDLHAEKDIASFDKGMGSSHERVLHTLNRIKDRGYLNRDMKVLDVGGGTGIFTIPFAKLYKQVDTLDISEKMQMEIQSKARAEQLSNIRYLCKNWHTIDIKSEQMENQYDLVLSSINCRGIYNYETLNKMNQASRGGCCLITWAGKSKNNHSHALQNIILGRNLQTAGGNDIIFPFNLIYHMGGEPDLNYSTISWTKVQTPQDAISSICFNYWRFAEITDHIKSEIEKYVYTHLENGEFVERTEHLIGIMVWDAWKI